MTDDILNKKLHALEAKIADVQKNRAFKEHLHDGHSKTLAEIQRHYKDTHDKIESNLHSYEEKQGHLNFLEEQLIIFANSIEEL